MPPATRRYPDPLSPDLVTGAGLPSVDRYLHADAVGGGPHAAGRSSPGRGAQSVAWRAERPDLVTAGPSHNRAREMSARAGSLWRSALIAAPD